MVLFQSALNDYGFYLFILILFGIGIWMEKERQRGVDLKRKHGESSFNPNPPKSKDYSLHDFKTYHMAFPHLKLDHALGMFTQMMFRRGHISKPTQIDISDEEVQKQYTAAAKAIIFRINKLQDTYEGKEYIMALEYEKGLVDIAGYELLQTAFKAIKSDYHKNLYKEAASSWNDKLFDEEDNIELPYSFRTPMAKRVKRN